MLSKYKNLLLYACLILSLLSIFCFPVMADSEPIAVISMSPQQNFTTETEIIFSADNSIPSDGATITSTSWGGDFSITGYYTEGEHTVTLTVTDSNGLVSQPAEISFFVTNANAIENMENLIKSSNSVQQSFRNVNLQELYYVEATGGWKDQTFIAKVDNYYVLIRGFKMSKDSVESEIENLSFAKIQSVG